MDPVFLVTPTEITLPPERRDGMMPYFINVEFDEEALAPFKAARNKELMHGNEYYSPDGSASVFSHPDLLRVVLKTPLLYAWITVKPDNSLREYSLEGNVIDPVTGEEKHLTRFSPGLEYDDADCYTATHQFDGNQTVEDLLPTEMFASELQMVLDLVEYAFFKEVEN